MKKYFSYIILLFVLNSCATTQEVLNSGDIKKGMSKLQLQRAYAYTDVPSDPFLDGCMHEYFPEVKMEIISSKNSINQNKLL